VPDRTEGHCHFCGDGLVFEKYGVNDINNLDGAWEADHVIQRGKGIVIADEKLPEFADENLPVFVQE